MTTECYMGDCPHHGCNTETDEGPFCYEPVCLEAWRFDAPPVAQIKREWKEPPAGWNGEPLMADGTYADPDKFGVIALDRRTPI
jgi:hypothetical protein